jgi:sulfur carrier protein
MAADPGDAIAPQSHTQSYTHPHTSMISITVNGEPAHVAAPCTITALLAQHDLTGKRVAVEHNGAIVPKSRHAETLLNEADRLEIVVAVGGG